MEQNCFKQKGERMNMLKLSLILLSKFWMKNLHIFRLKI